MKLVEVRLAQSPPDSDSPRPSADGRKPPDVQATVTAVEGGKEEIRSTVRI
jgi:hypothetical protein